MYFYAGTLSCILTDLHLRKSDRSIDNRHRETNRERVAAVQQESLLFPQR